jgi:hypothetical protein
MTDYLLEIKYTRWSGGSMLLDKVIEVLGDAKQKGGEVTIFMENGRKFSGFVRSFDKQNHSIELLYEVSCPHEMRVITLDIDSGVQAVDRLVESLPSSYPF